MKTGLVKSHSYGFILSEQELKNIYNVLVQQIMIITSNFVSSFELNYKNGMLVERDTLNAVLSEENAGSLKICGLTIIILEEKQLKYPTKITIKFANADKPISYDISGNDRDWVYNTGLQIEKSLKKIKNNYRLPTAKDNTSTSVYLGSFVLLFTLSLLAVFFLHPTFGLGDIITVLISLIFFVSSIALLSFCIVPINNFYWGEYMKVFDKRLSVAKAITFTLLIPLILGLIGSVIANFLPIGHR